MQKIESGDAVRWKYRHNWGLASVQKEKQGTFAGFIRHTIKHRGPQMCAVKFPNNKRVSIVPFCELTILEKHRED